MTLFGNPQVVLLCSDVAQSLAFYEGLGFEEVFRTPTHGLPIHVDVVLDGYRIGLASVTSTRDDHGLTPGASGQRAAVVLWTDDVREAFARLLELGATPLRAPYPWLGRLEIAWAEDPAGHVVQVAQRVT